MAKNQEQLVARVKAWAMRNYNKLWGASVIIECMTDEEIAAEFQTLQDAVDFAELQTEARQNARCDM